MLCTLWASMKHVDEFKEGIEQGAIVARVLNSYLGTFYITGCDMSHSSQQILYFFILCADITRPPASEEH